MPLGRYRVSGCRSQLSPHRCRGSHDHAAGRASNVPVPVPDPHRRRPTVGRRTARPDLRHTTDPTDHGLGHHRPVDVVDAVLHWVPGVLALLLLAVTATVLGAWLLFVLAAVLV